MFSERMATVTRVRRQFVFVFINTLHRFVSKRLATGTKMDVTQCCKDARPVPGATTFLQRKIVNGVDDDQRHRRIVESIAMKIIRVGGIAQVETSSPDPNSGSLLIGGRAAILLPWRLFREELDRDAVREMRGDVRKVFLEAGLPRWPCDAKPWKQHHGRPGP